MSIIPNTAFFFTWKETEITKYLHLNEIKNVTQIEINKELFFSSVVVSKKNWTEFRVLWIFCDLI